MKNINTIKRLLGYLLPYKLKLVILIFISIFGVVFTVAKPLPVKIIIDNVLLRKDLLESRNSFCNWKKWSDVPSDQQGFAGLSGSSLVVIYSKH